MHGQRVTGICFVAALLTACGGAATRNDVFPAVNASPAHLTRASDDERVLYSFKGFRKDAAGPNGGVIALNGVVYGTTQSGGSCRYHSDCGTVFQVTPSGSEQILYRFGGAHDVETPSGGVLAAKGLLYGTTTDGGANNAGTVFVVDPSTGSERVVYSFKGQDAADGAGPSAGLVAMNGAFYGTTSYGGGTRCGAGALSGCGTLFQVTPSGEERVLHAFKGGGETENNDGGLPQSSLVAMNGMLYGTTVGGGRYSVKGLCRVGCGTVFEISPSGDRYRVLYRFKGGADGRYPFAGVVNVNGNLYGTTYTGGTGGGTVFQVTPYGSERILHRFAGGSDGEEPSAGLLPIKGMLYGTTVAGGSSISRGCGCGTVFRLSTTGEGYSVIHSFTGIDGSYPLGVLIHAHHLLYGTTLYGGDFASGTAFTITP